MRSSLLIAAGVLSLSTTAFAAEPPAIQVLAKDWVALRFEPQFPHGRHTQNPLPGDGAPVEGTQPTTYRIPVPDFATDAGIDKVMLIADIEGESTLKVDDTPAEAAVCPAALCGKLHLPAGKKLATLSAAEKSVNEVALSFTSSGKAFIHGAAFRPVVLVHTTSPMARAIGFTMMEQSGLPMPRLTPLFDQFLRDTSICRGGDGMFYMTGTTGGPEMMVVTSDLSVLEVA